MDRASTIDEENAEKGSKKKRNSSVDGIHKDKIKRIKMAKGMEKYRCSKSRILLCWNTTKFVSMIGHCFSYLTIIDKTLKIWKKKNP